MCGCGAKDLEVAGGMAGPCTIHDGVSHPGEVHSEFHPCLLAFTHNSSRAKVARLKQHFHNSYGVSIQKEGEGFTCLPVMWFVSPDGKVA